MTVQIVLLRAVNVGGRGAVAMSDLRDVIAALGFKEARSLLQSGNLMFDAGRQAGPALERLLEREAAKRLELRTDFFVRSVKELDAIVAKNPFRTEARDDPGHLVVMLLKEAPGAEAVEALRAAIKGREVIHAAGRHLYIAYPDGIGRSRLTHAVIEGKLGTRGTGRNWNTVLKLAELARDMIRSGGRYPPHPNPLPKWGEGARPSGSHCCDSTSPTHVRTPDPYSG
jgi:uncharacterized protein (DUF1697 family)